MSYFFGFRVRFLWSFWRVVVRLDFFVDIKKGGLWVFGIFIIFLMFIEFVVFEFSFLIVEFREGFCYLCVSRF